MKSALAFQEERAQDYDPPLSGWRRAVAYKMESALDAFSDSPADAWQHTAIVRYPLWKFVAKKDDEGPVTTLTSNQPIEVEVRRGEQLYFAENEALSIFAAGDTEQDAISDFSVQVVCQFEHYQDTSVEQLFGEAVRLKEVFLASFKLE